MELKGQLGFFDKPLFKTSKTIRLIELFAGIGSQAKALKNLGVPFEHHFVCEIDKYACMSYAAVHGVDVVPTDVSQITAEDLNITDTDRYTYLLTYLLIPLYRPFCCRKDARDGRGIRNKVFTPLGG